MPQGNLRNGDPHLFRWRSTLCVLVDTCATANIKSQTHPYPCLSGFDAATSTTSENDRTAWKENHDSERRTPAHENLRERTVRVSRPRDQNRGGTRFRLKFTARSPAPAALPARRRARGGHPPPRRRGRTPRGPRPPARPRAAPRPPPRASGAPRPRARAPAARAARAAKGATAATAARGATAASAEPRAERPPPPSTAAACPRRATAGASPRRRPSCARMPRVPGRGSSRTRASRRACAGEARRLRARATK